MIAVICRPEASLDDGTSIALDCYRQFLMKIALHGRPLSATSKSAFEGRPERKRSNDGRFDLGRFTLADMVRCGRALRRLSRPSLEETAEAIVRYLYKHLWDRDSEGHACVLVRFFKTHPYCDLSPELARFAQSLMPDVSLGPETRCLTLMATAGDEPAWNSRRNSRRHQAIPLPSEAALNDIPMISQLLLQLGLKSTDLLAPHPEIIKDLDHKTFNVFHVPAVLNSAFVPAQKDFVVPYGVESALGFGGILPDGDLFAVILFSKVPISTETAAMFRTIALNVRMAVLPGFQSQACVR
jgi:hypothetical protein